MGRKKPTVEEKILRGLEGFTDTLESGSDMNKMFTCTTVSLKVPKSNYTPAKVKKVRKALGTSQTLFAQFLGSSLSNVQKWERGERTPSAMACRFMDEVMADPALYRKRFLGFAKPVATKRIRV